MYVADVARSLRSEIPPRDPDLGQLDESVRLEGAEMVVHLLPSEPDTSGERRR